jgi:hypothetical protein
MRNDPKYFVTNFVRGDSLYNITPEYETTIYTFVNKNVTLVLSFANNMYVKALPSFVRQLNVPYVNVVEVGDFRRFP